MKFDHVDSLNPSLLLCPYGQAERALGRLAHGLQSSPLHATWLWRELTRISVVIAQAGGHHAKVDHLRAALIGAPVEREDSTPGLAAAKRVFLASAPLFRSSSQTDSNSALWPEFWSDAPTPPDDRAFDDENHEPSRRDRSGDVDGVGQEMGERGQLMVLVGELAAFADDGRRPALINLFIDLRKHAGTRRLPPGLVRIALPLALAEADLVPKAAPGLLGGRRLPLGLSRAGTPEKPLTAWLADALGELAVEADQAYRRLAELTRQYQAWHEALAAAGLRRHARAPKALDLLAATPVLNIGMVTSHLGCSHVAAGKTIARLMDLGILIEQTSRSRHKVFVAGDLPADTRGEAEQDAALTLSKPVPLVDVDAIEASLDGLFADLDRMTARARERIAESS